MAVLRTRKTDNYTVIDNNVFRNRELSMKAKGLLCQMLSLPDGWDYSIAGLAALVADGESAIRSALNELKEHHYFDRKQVRKNGKIAEIEYIVSEIPMKNIENLVVENLKQENLVSEKQPQLNTKELNTKRSNTKPNRERGGKKIPPTLEEVKAYCQERNSPIDPEYFYDYYESLNWMRGKTKVKDWQATLRTWERRERDGQKKTEADKGGTGGSGIDYDQFIDVQ